MNKNWRNADLIIGIDATNIRAGGGVTHLKELLNATVPNSDLVKFVVWGGVSTLNMLPDSINIHKISHKLQNKKLIFRLIWQIFYLSSSARKNNCDILFIPGGIYLGTFRPYVAMSQNLLPFCWYEVKKYRFSLMTLKLLALKHLQSLTFRNADGLIFLNEYAKLIIKKYLKKMPSEVAIIPHGVSSNLGSIPLKTFDINNFSYDKPLEILYVSTLDEYKNHKSVIESINQLRSKGYPLALLLVGSANLNTLRSIERFLENIPNAGDWVRYCGPKSYEQMYGIYSVAKVAIFASTCENMPNILLEKMASGIPLACSRAEPMFSILGNSGIYFDPMSVQEISDALIKILDSKEARENMASTAREKSKNYSWRLCSKSTINFLIKIGRNA